MNLFPQLEAELLYLLVVVPAKIFTAQVAAIGEEVWSWIVDARPDLESRLMVEITAAWARTIRSKQGLFSPLHKYAPFHPSCAILKKLTRLATQS